MGDFGAHFKRPTTGIHTVEGNVAGSRAAALTKKRQSEQESFEEKKQQIIREQKQRSKTIHDKFDSNAHVSFAERSFREKTIGLVSAEDFKKIAQETKELAKRRMQGLDSSDKLGEDDGEEMDEETKQKLENKKRKEAKRLKKKRKKMLSTLSFADAEDADGIIDGETAEDEEKPKTTKKNPNVDTSFLPDKEREEIREKERKRLRLEWIERQEDIKKERLEITYSYWDGSGHRRYVQCQKGDTIAQFLELVRKDLAKEFREMVNVTSDALIYVKEDLIIPQDITFYDLIATKARGKSGPLFNFDVHDDVRVGAIDSRVEKDESHPGKVVERRWYDRNKHIFPASRWEVFDPAKEYGQYTIHGGEVNKNSK